MKKTRFNGDYCGDIIIIGFTGEATKIQDYLWNTFKIKSEDSAWSCDKTKFNTEISPDVIAHIETYPWATREDFIPDSIKTTKNGTKRKKA